MIDYAVFMMDKKTRQSYKMSAKTIANAGKLSEKSMELAKNAVKELVEKNPKRKAMIEELKKLDWYKRVYKSIASHRRFAYSYKKTDMVQKQLRDLQN